MCVHGEGAYTWRCGSYLHVCGTQFVCVLVCLKPRRRRVTPTRAACVWCVFVRHILRHSDNERGLFCMRLARKTLTNRHTHSCAPCPAPCLGARTLAHARALTQRGSLHPHVVHYLAKTAGLWEEKPQIMTGLRRSSCLSPAAQNQRGLSAFGL